VGSTDPACTTTVTTPVTALSQTIAKTMANADNDGSGTVSVGDVLTYTVTVTNTSASGNLTNVVVNDSKITPSSTTCATVAPGATCVLTGTYTVTAADVTAGSISNTATSTSTACPVGSTDPSCTTTINTPVVPSTVSYTKTASTAGPVVVGDVITYTLTTTVANAQTIGVLTLTDTLGAGLDFVAVTGQSPASAYSCNAANPLVCTLPAGTVPGVYTVTYTARVNAQATGGVTNAVVGTGTDNPTCTGTCTTTTPVTASAVSYEKTASTAGPVVVGDVITYTLTATVINAQTTGVTTLTDTMGSGLDFVAVTSAGAFTCNAANPLVCTLPAGTVPGSYAVTYTARVNGQAGGSVNNAVVGTGTDAPNCSNAGCSVTTEVAPPVVSYTKSASTAGPVAQGDTITYTLTTTVANAPTRNALTLTDTLGTGLDFTAVTGAAGYSCNAANPLVCTLPAGTVPGTYTVSYTATVNAQASETVNNTVVGTGTDNPACVGACTTSTTVAPPPTLRVIKQASPRDVKIGDLVRYTVTVENTGTVDAIDATLVDTPPAGFTFVDGSLSVADRDGVGRLVGTYPIQVDQVDIAAGERATFTYLLRVGAGVRAGIHSNSALMRDNGKIVSNVATAEVQLIADPLLDHALILGTVFDDRDSDGWQDSAAIDDARVQGGFAAEAYVPNSTTVDRGNGPKAEPDASSPMLHGIVLGSISARQSDADPADAHRVVISQRLKELSFNDDFALTTKQGVTVRMDAAGTTRIERSGDAAKNLSGAAPTVERRVSPTEGGYLVDYIVRNTGVDERGIPGVRIASIEGLLMETDQYGRYHLEGVDVGTLERGRNFILKVDPSTLPPGTVFTTDNPLTRRVTPGLPVRFDWGVKLPAGLIEGGEEQVEMELGEVFFAPGSAEVRAQYLPAIEKMADKIKQHRGGEVVISANGDSESLAFDRASAVKAALVKQLPADVLQALKVSVRGNADDPGSLIVGLGEGGALLGTVLFDTNKETIRPEFEPLLDKVAAALERMHGGVIAIVGHTDVRASYQYNTALGMRRAKAVYDALAQRLSPEVRAKVRVESSNDPTAPVDVKRN
ncbi:isopeptide-forming domain-containing fimbrial protein, partial [Lysobacter sp. CA196]|uniref:isopeptide-forming domain-containing fimbrial protein n=1 Tax=Lysobacter sp. CA196 TaxID=3455606 RepID=UPI003F8D193D